MYHIQWDKVIPTILPKIINRRLKRAHGSFFDCRFILDFEDHSGIHFQSDNVLHREAIEFEIILNRQKIYNPLHFDSTHVFTNNLGIITNAIEIRTAKRGNVREIAILFDAEKKFNKLTQIIVGATRFNRFKFEEAVSEIITSYLQPRCDKMTIRTFRKSWHKLKRYEPSTINQVTKHEKLIKELYHNKSNDDGNGSNGDNSKGIDYNDSVLNLYPIKSRADDENGNDMDIVNGSNDIVQNLYPIGNVMGNDRNANDQQSISKERESMEKKVNNASDSKSKGKDYDKVYCDVVCRLSSWNTYTATAKKQKY